MKAGSGTISGLYPPSGGPLTPVAMMPIGPRPDATLFMIDTVRPECAILRPVCKHAFADATARNPGRGGVYG